MKPKSSLLSFLALAGSSLLAVSSASAQTTYTWIDTATGTQPWTDATNWDVGNGQFVSGASNELVFYADVSALPSSGTQTISGVPLTLSMNTLTLNGRSPNNINGFTILFDPASTWTIGDGTTSTINLNSIKHSFDARSVFYKLPNLVLNAGTTTITGNGNGAGFHFTGSITELAAGTGILKSGTSRIDFQASNSYTGTTEVTGGILRLSHANALSGGIGATGGTSALTLNGGVIELAAGNFMRNLGTGSDQFQITGGASGFSAVGAARVVTVNNDENLELVWGSASFSPTTLELNSLRAYGATNPTNPRPSETDTTDYDLTLSNKIDLNGATRNIQVDSKTAHLPGVIRNSSGTAGINKSGNGTLLLTAANTYNGNTTLSGGTVSIENSGNAGIGGGIIFDGGTLGIRGTTLTELSGLGHAVTFNSNKAAGFDITDAANTFTADQVLNQGNGGLIKAGAGTLVLNQANTFTGATTITAGTLILDYGSGQDNSKIGNAALNLSGGSLVLRGGSHAQAVSSIVIAANTGNSISRDGGSTATIANAGVLTANTNSNLTISEAGIVSTTTGNTNGIQANGRVTVGSDFATNVSNILQAATYTPYTAADANAVFTTVGQLTGGGTKTGALSNYALKIVNDANSNVLELGSNNLVVANGSTMLYAGGFDNNYTINGSTGLVGTQNGGQTLNMNIYTGTLTVNARLTSGGASRLVKAGAGTLVAGGANVYSGATYIQQGVLRLANASGLGAVSTGDLGTFVQAGAALELSNNITVGAEALALSGAGISNGGALRNQAGSNTYGGAITIGASGARINSDATTSLNLTGGIATALTQDVTFGGAGDTTVSTTAISGGGSVVKDGAGVLTLSATNTYTGTTTVSAGKLVVNGSIATSSLTTVASGATIGGSGTLGALTISSGGFIAPGNSPGILTVNGDYVQAGAYTAEINGLIAGTQHDQINVTGTVNITGGSLTALFTGSYSANDLIFILLNDGSDAITGIYSGLAQGSTVTSYGGFNWNISYLADSAGVTFTGGNDIALQAAIIPEPNVAALIGLAGLCLLLRRRRR